jgi:hypothetical protein
MRVLQHDADCKNFGNPGPCKGSVAWEIDIAKRTVIRDKRMVGEKDGGTCKTISHEQSGFED